MDLIDKIVGDPYHAIIVHSLVQGCGYLIWYNPQIGNLDAFEFHGIDWARIPLSAVPDSGMVEKVELGF